jgi:endonuclease YncB( thermonuclease family)
VPIQRRRRIFRPDTLGPPHGLFGVRPTLIVGVAAVALAGGAVLLSLPSTLFGRVPTVSGTLRAVPATVAVVDGATLRLGDRVVRLRGVVAPARGRPCQAQDGHVFDCGAAAADGLAALLRGQLVACTLAGRDGSGFPEGICMAGNTELNRAVIVAGWARAGGDASAALRAAEVAAQVGQAGLWGTKGGAAAF